MNRNQITHNPTSRLSLWCGIVAFALLAVGLHRPVQASIILQLSDQQMTTQAHRIVHGKVVRKYSLWEAKERRIYTYITLAVLDMIKGTSDTEVVIRQVGGTANGLGMHVPGTASFQLGEEVLVFLERSRDSAHYLVMGMSYGKYRVKIDTKTQMRILHRDLHGVSLARWDAQKKMQIHHVDTNQLKPVRMEDFVDKIRQYMNPGVVKPSVRPAVRPPATSTVKVPTRSVQVPARSSVPSNPTPQR